MITCAFNCSNCLREFTLSAMRVDLRCCPFCGAIRDGGLVDSREIETSLLPLHQAVHQLRFIHSRAAVMIRDLNLEVGSVAFRCGVKL